MAKIGDKFIIEIESVMTNKNGKLYGIKGFRTLVFDDEGLKRLTKANDCVNCDLFEKGRAFGYAEGLCQKLSDEEGQRLRAVYDKGFSDGYVNGAEAKEDEIRHSV